MLLEASLTVLHTPGTCHILVVAGFSRTTGARCRRPVINDFQSPAHLFVSQLNPSLILFRLITKAKNGSWAISSQWFGHARTWFGSPPCTRPRCTWEADPHTSYLFFWRSVNELKKKQHGKKHPRKRSGQFRNFRTGYHSYLQ